MAKKRTVVLREQHGKSQASQDRSILPGRVANLNLGFTTACLVVEPPVKFLLSFN